MTFIKDGKGNRIDDETGTRFNIYHFDKDGINEFTGTEWDEEGYNQYGVDKNGYDRAHNYVIEKKIEEEIQKREKTTKENNKRESYSAIRYDIDFFNDDLKPNRVLIKNKIDGMNKKVQMHREKMRELKEGLNDALSNRDLDDRMMYKNELQILSYAGGPKVPPDLNATLEDPYFFFGTDLNMFYISNKDIDIEEGDKKIIPFTNYTAHKLRFENYGNNKFKILFDQGKIKSISDENKSKEKNTFSIKEKNIKKYEEIENERKKITNGIKKSGVGDISKLLKEEQDTIMSAPTNGITLITGVAGSGKTNILLHRIQYLLWEQPGKNNSDEIVFHNDKILFLCFNKALQKYINSSIKNNEFPKIIVKTIDQEFLDTFKNYFPNKTIDFDIDGDYNYDEAKKAIDNYVGLLNEDNIEDFYETIKWDSYEFKEGNSKKSQGVAIIDINPKILNNILPGSGTYTKKHLLTRMLLLSITSFKQDGANTFTLTIGDRKFKGLRAKGKTNQNIDYISNKTVYDHIFIDEVQDLTKLQMQVINGFHKNSMTIAGDESQLITTGSLKTSLADLFGIDIKNKYELNLSHRNSQQTARFANEFLKNLKIKNEIKSISFSGEMPLVTKVVDKKSEYDFIIKEIKKLKSTKGKISICIMYPKKTFIDECVNYLSERGVDCYFANSSSWEFNNSVHVTNYHQAKGLEFDYIFICGLNNFETRNINNKNNIIYTLITRGIKRVYIPVIGKKPDIFGDIDQSTYLYNEE